MPLDDAKSVVDARMTYRCVRINPVGNAPVWVVFLALVTTIALGARSATHPRERTAL